LNSVCDLQVERDDAVERRAQDGGLAHFAFPQRILRALPFDQLPQLMGYRPEDENQFRVGQGNPRTEKLEHLSHFAIDRHRTAKAADMPQACNRSALA